MSGFQVAISIFQVSNHYPGQGFKLQFPSFKFQTMIRVRVSSCNFQVSSFKQRSRSGFQVVISKLQVSNQDPGQGFKLQVPSFKFQTKIQVRVSRWVRIDTGGRISAWMGGGVKGTGCTKNVLVNFGGYNIFGDADPLFKIHLNLQFGVSEFISKFKYSYLNLVMTPETRKCILNPAPMPVESLRYPQFGTVHCIVYKNI